MNNKNPENTPELSIEIDSGGIRRILIYSDDPDQQAVAHRLLACVASQLFLLDAALKSEGVPTAPVV
jgi:hypothetical protein